MRNVKKITIHSSTGKLVEIATKRNLMMSVENKESALVPQASSDMNQVSMGNNNRIKNQSAAGNIYESPEVIQFFSILINNPPAEKKKRKVKKKPKEKILKPPISPFLGAESQLQGFRLGLLV